MKPKTRATLLKLLRRDRAWKAGRAREYRDRVASTTPQEKAWNREQAEMIDRQGAELAAMIADLEE